MGAIAGVDNNLCVLSRRYIAISQLQRIKPVHCKADVKLWVVIQYRHHFTGSIGGHMVNRGGGAVLLTTLVGCRRTKVTEVSSVW